MSALVDTPASRTPSPVALSCCSPLTDAALDDAAAESLARVFKALGDPTRVRLLSLIAGAAEGEACVCDLIEPVGLSQPTVSHHMKQLADAGLVHREQRGKWAYYRVIDEALTAIAEALRPPGRSAPFTIAAPGPSSSTSSSHDSASG